MADEKDTGGPAFPITEANGFNKNNCGEGMTLRDYFAAQAMAGLCASYKAVLMFLAETGNGATPPVNAIAKLAYEQADQMIKARQ